MTKKLSALLGCLCVSVLPLSANAAPKLLTTYHDLVAALKGGHRVNVVADNSNCKVTASYPAVEDTSDPDLHMVIGMSYSNSNFLIYKFDKHETVGVTATGSVTGTESGSAYRYKRIEVIDNDTAEIYASRADFPSGKRTNFVKTTCAINNGSNNGGVSLFDYDAE